MRFKRIPLLNKVFGVRIRESLPVEEGKPKSRAI